MDIKVLIADDEQSVREVLGDVIEREPGLELVGVAGDAQEAIDLAATALPDVALLDVRMPMGGGQAAARGIRLLSPDTVIIALSAHDDASNIVSMFERGAATYVAKTASTEEIIDAIRRGAGHQTGSAPSGS